MNHRGVVSMQKLKQKVFFAKVKQGTCKAKPVISLFTPKPPSIPPSVHWSSTHPSLSKGSLEGWWAFCVCLWIPDNVTSCQSFTAKLMSVMFFREFLWAFLCFFLAFCVSFFELFVFLFVNSYHTSQTTKMFPLTEERLLNFWWFSPKSSLLNVHTITITDIDSICELVEEDACHFQEVK